MPGAPPQGERKPLRPPPPPPTAPTIIEAPSLPPPARPDRVPRELPASPGREGQLLSIIDDLREELRESRELREAEPKKRRSIIESLRPKTPSGWALGIAAMIAALGTAGAAVVTALGGGEGLAAVVHAPKLREQIDAARKENAELAKKLSVLEASVNTDHHEDAQRWRFVGAALCKGAMVTARGVECDAIQWEPRAMPKKGEAPEPWRARDYEWPKPDRD